MSIKGKRVAFLGAGNMGEALIKGLTQSGLVPAGSITAADPRADHLGQVAKRYGIRAVTDNSALVSGADVIILAVKPQIMGSVLKAGEIPRDYIHSLHRLHDEVMVKL